MELIYFKILHKKKFTLNKLGLQIFSDAASNYIFKCVGVWSIYVPYILEHVTPKMETSKYCTPKLK